MRHATLAALRAPGSDRACRCLRGAAPERIVRMARTTRLLAAFLLGTCALTGVAAGCVVISAIDRSLLDPVDPTGGGGSGGAGGAGGATSSTSSGPMCSDPV